jgi:DNA-binding transcriptional MerR regulator
MTEPNLDAGLRNLRQSLRQIKALLDWQQLQEAESRHHEPPGFKITDSVETDLRNEYSFFLSTALQIHGILNDTSLTIPEAKRQNIKSQLAKVEQQLYSLNLNQKLCTC